MDKEQTKKQNFYKISGIIFSIALALFTPFIASILAMAGACGEGDGAGMTGFLIGLILAPLVGISGVSASLRFTSEGIEKGRKFILIYLLSVPLLLYVLIIFADRDTRTSLMIASSKGDSLKVARLLKRGKDPDEILCYRGGNTYALKEAIEGNHFETVKVLVKNGANINLDSFYPPIVVASKKGNPEILLYLIEKGARVDSTNYYGHTALIIAAENGYDTIVEILIDKGADVNFTNKGTNALEQACLNGHEQVVKILLNKGVDIKSLGERGCISLEKIMSESRCD